MKKKPLVIRDIRVEDDLSLKDPLLTSEGFVSMISAPLVSKARVNGAIEFFQRSHRDFDDDCLEFVELLAGQTAIAVDHINMIVNLQRSNAEVQMAYDATLLGWVKALDLRDKETESHTHRVVDMAVQLARWFGITGDELSDIRRGALLHDIGKLGIPDRILHKTGPLNDKEWSIMHKHPIYANDMLAPIAYLEKARDIPLYHHERWDGSGYPYGLSREEIPLPARIFALVDVWDALRSDRPYRKAWPEDKTLAYIQDQAGKEFDPNIAQAFLDLLSQMKL